MVLVVFILRRLYGSTWLGFQAIAIKIYLYHSITTVSYVIYTTWYLVFWFNSSSFSTSIIKDIFSSFVRQCICVWKETGIRYIDKCQKLALDPIEMLGICLKSWRDLYQWTVPRDSGAYSSVCLALPISSKTDKRSFPLELLKSLPTLSRVFGEFCGEFLLIIHILYYVWECAFVIPVINGVGFQNSLSVVLAPGVSSCHGDSTVTHKIGK